MVKNKSLYIDISKRVLIFLILVVVFIPVAATVFWTHNTLLNTDNYVKTMAPVRSDPNVQTSLSNFVTDGLFKKVDTQTIIKNALPPNGQFLALPLNNALENFSRTQINQIISSETFANIWEEASRVAHTQITKLLLNQGRVLTAEEGKVSLDMSKVFTLVQERFGGEGLTFIQNVTPDLSDKQFVIIDSPTLAKYQRYVAFIESLYPWVQILVIVFLGLIIWLSVDKAGGIVIAGLAVLMGIILESLLIVFFRNGYISSVHRPYFTPEVAGVVFDALTKPLWTQIFILLLISLGLILGGLYYQKRVRTKSSSRS